MISLTSSEATTLANLASDALTDVLANGGAGSARPWDEVSAVKAVTLDGFDQVADAWSPVLARIGYQMTLSSVFTHSRPWVVSSAGRCELADLLVVIDDQGGLGAPADRRAVLIQAKTLKTNASRIHLRREEHKQFELLSQWPPFTFEDSSYDARPRDFRSPSSPGDPHFSGEYGAIDLRVQPRTWTQQLLGRPHNFVASERLGPYLVRLAMGVDLYGRPAVAGANDDWSFTVDELLSVTGSKEVVAGSGVTRGQFRTLGLMALKSGDPPGGTGEDEGDGWRAGPISTVRFTFTRSEEGRRDDIGSGFPYD